MVTLDLETRTARAVPFNGNYYTTPMGNTDITIIHGRKEKPWKRIDAVFGDVNVNAQVSLYRKLQFHNHQNLGYEQINPSLSREFETESVWLKLPGNVVAAYRRLLQELSLIHILGVTVGIENVWNHFLMSPLEMRQFIDEIGSS